MATEFSITVEDQPGALANLTEVLARSGINVIALHATPCPEQGLVQFITSHSDATVQALREAQIDYTVQQVLLLNLSDEPGTLARLARALADRGININSVYITMSGQIVLDADDLNRAQRVALDLGLA